MHLRVVKTNKDMPVASRKNMKYYHAGEMQCYHINPQYDPMKQGFRCCCRVCWIQYHQICRIGQWNFFLGLVSCLETYSKSF